MIQSKLTLYSVKNQSNFLILIQHINSILLTPHILKNRNSELYKLDHQFPGKLAKDKPIAVLYGQIGSKSLNAFHVVLKKLAESGEITYILRHYVSDRKGPKVRLSGTSLKLFTC